MGHPTLWRWGLENLKRHHETYLEPWKEAQKPSQELLDLADAATSDQSFEDLISKLTSDDEDEDESATPPDQDPNLSTPGPDDDFGCDTEASKRAGILFECLRGYEIAEQNERTMGWGPLAPYVYVLDPPPTFTNNCSMMDFADYNSEDGWTDPAEDESYSRLLPGAALDFNGEDGWTDPCDGDCTGGSTFGLFDFGQTDSAVFDRTDLLDAIENRLEAADLSSVRIGTLDRFGVHQG